MWVVSQFPLLCNPTFVPFLEQLSALLSLPEVQNCLETHYSHNDVCDGEYLKTHPLQNCVETINICLYTDEFETVNPIGAHR